MDYLHKNACTTDAWKVGLHNQHNIQCFYRNMSNSFTEISSETRIIQKINSQHRRYSIQQICFFLARMKLSLLFSRVSSAVITMIELPWWQVLIDGPISHYWVTATLELALTDILLDNCHWGTQSSCNLTVEVSHRHAHMHNAELPTRVRAHTKVPTGTKRGMYRLAHTDTPRLSKLTQMCPCIANRTFK